eukprot:5736416-Amphidinium_carterae.1
MPNLPTPIGMATDGAKGEATFNARGHLVNLGSLVYYLSNCVYPFSSHTDHVCLGECGTKCWKSRIFPRTEFQHLNLACTVHASKSEGYSNLPCQLCSRSGGNLYSKAMDMTWNSCSVKASKRYTPVTTIHTRWINL